MPDTETYGGTCPGCRAPLLQKYDAGSHGLWFDVCAWCGFGHGTAGGASGDVETLSADALLTIVLEHHRCENIEALRQSLVGTSRSSWAITPSVFRYEAGQGDDPAFRATVPPVDAHTFARVVAMPVTDAP